MFVFENLQQNPLNYIKQVKYDYISNETNNNL